MRSRSRTSVLASLIAIPLMILSSPVEAATRNATDGGQSGSTVVLVPGGAPGGQSASASAVERCDIHVDYPRAQGSSYVYAYGSLTCTLSEPHLQITVRIWKKRWWGYQEVTSNFRVVNGYNSTKVEYTGKHTCAGPASNTYRSTATIQVWWRNGTTTIDEVIGGYPVYNCD